MARKSMNITDLEAWIITTGNKIKGARITNIYYDKDKGILLLKLKSNEVEGILVAEPGKRIHLTRRIEPPKDYKPLPLVVLSRKHMRGSRISNIRTIGQDRILLIESDRGYKIVVELVPRGFIVLLDSSDTILAADRYEKLRDRVIQPKKSYKPPPGRGINLESINADTIREGSSGQRDLVRGLIRGLGIPGEVAEEACFRAGIDTSTKPSSLNDADYESIASVLREIWREALSSRRGYIAFKDGVPVEANPFEPKRFNEKKVYESFDDALDEFFAADIDRRGASESKRSNPVERELEKLKKSLEQAMAIEEEYRRKAIELRWVAERIPMQYDTVSRILDCIRKSNPYDCPYVVQVQGGRKRVTIEINSVRFNAIIGETIDELIVRLFREAGEYEAKAERAKASRRDIESKIKEVELKALARSIQERAKRRSRFWFEKYHWTVTRSGILAIGGRDAGQNESIVKRYLEDNDIFIHAEIHGAPAVVVKTGGKIPDIRELLDAAIITVAYSRGWREGVGSLAAYWVWGSQVSKTPPSGEYVARGGFIIRGKRSYLPPIRMRLAIGITMLDEEIPFVITGSENVVSTYSVVYVVIEPGDAKVEAASKEIKQRMEDAVGPKLRPLIMAVPEDEVVFRIPGRARIVSVKRGAGESITGIL